MPEQEPMINGLKVHVVPLGDIEPASIVGKWEKSLTQAAGENLRTHGWLEPTVHILGRDVHPDRDGDYCGYIIGVGSLMESGSHKDVLASILPPLCEQLRAYAVCLITEAWYVEGEGEGAYEAMVAWKIAHDDSLEDYPGRVETVSVATETRSGQHTHVYPILRDAEGEVTGLAEDLHAGDDERRLQSEGRFSNLLRPLTGEDVH